VTGRILMARNGPDLSKRLYHLILITARPAVFLRAISFRNTSEHDLT
jgi:hypothetical protein